MDAVKNMLRFLGLYDIAYKIYCKMVYEKLAVPYKLAARFSRKMGTTQNKRNPELIVSLTSFPARIPTIHLCIETLLQQTLKPDRLILWLSNSEISPKTLPACLTRLQKRGLEIKWCENIRSYKKIIPVLRDFPDALIVTADDDVFYPHSWLEELYNAYQKEPQYIHCHIAHRLKHSPDGKLLPYMDWHWLACDFQGPSMDIFPTGVGGVLYAPGHLNPEVLNEAVFTTICPNADDIWLKAMSYINGVECKKIRKESMGLRTLRIKNDTRLFHDGNMGGGNDLQIKAVSEKYDVYRDKS